MTPPRTTDKDTYDPKSHESIRVHDIEVRGKRYEVTVGREGTFYTKVHNRGVHATSREELRNAVMKATKRARVTVEVPFSITQTVRYSRKRTVKSGIAVGLHQGHGAILVKYDDGSTEQLDTGFSSSTTLVPLADDEAKEWVRLQDERDRTYAELQEFEKTHRLDLRKVVEAAVEEKAGDGN